ncbi:hypothetical protein FDA38_11140 [Kribbella jiaozuonensis]|uniref:RNA polymerase sigma-70 domain-containing protein n=1 Tax=Kribbella jiaozuonensis TaxID=2575441 RepID=A0A4V5UXD7_9ACTN|nr:hypothetical protein FDA38_12185 [Kribbella jiaozuonensis]TKK83253.1 hypothetical protein FDA38_11140 [Kribbella jiaozuonensis]
MPMRRVAFKDPTAQRAVPEELLEGLLEALFALSAGETHILVLRFGLLDGMPWTLAEIAEPYGVTEERVRQIEGKAMSKLRHPAHSQKLRDALLDDGFRLPEPLRRRVLERFYQKAGQGIPGDGRLPLIFCDRHGWREAPRATARICEACICPLPRSWTGRPPQYCSGGCRQAAYRRRLKTSKNPRGGR